NIAGGVSNNYHILIKENTIDSALNAGIFCSQVDSLKVIGNRISSAKSTATNAKGISVANCDYGFEILKNKITSNQTGFVTGILIDSVNNEAPPRYLLIANNEISLVNSGTDNVAGILISASSPSSEANFR